MHDCLPQSLSAQSIPRTETVWNGDVWKAFVKMRTDPNLDCYTCCADHGIGIIFKKDNKNLLDIKINNFKKLKFIDFYNNHKKLMINIILPHPRMHRRNFVLLPLFEINKDWIHPVTKNHIKKLILSLPNRDIRSIKQI